MIIAAPKARSADPASSGSRQDDRALFPRAHTRGRIAVVACHFNWGDYRRPALNLLRFLRQMDRDGIPVYGIEAVKPGGRPLLEENRRWQTVQVTRRGILWQKEALLNAAAKLVPRHIPFIAAIDPDVWFDNPDWVNDSAAMLNDHPVIQPFETAVWTDESGESELARHSAASQGLDERWNGHPGFAWVFRRDFFDRVGFYPFSASGAGDTVLASSLMGLWRRGFSTPRMSVGKLNLESGVFREWDRRCRDWLNGKKPGSIAGTLWHEWHGTRQNRKYQDRHKLIENMDVLRDLRIRDEGWLEWTEQADRRMVVGLSNYFQHRKEDG